MGTSNYRRVLGPHLISNRKDMLPVLFPDLTGKSSHPITIDKKTVRFIITPRTANHTFPKFPFKANHWIITIVRRTNAIGPLTSNPIGIAFSSSPSEYANQRNTTKTTARIPIPPINALWRSRPFSRSKCSTQSSSGTSQ